MKTDAQLLQDAIADLQRTAAQAGPGGGKVPIIEMRVTLSDCGKRSDPGTGDPARRAVDWADFREADAPAAPSACRTAPTWAGTAWASRTRRSSSKTARPLRSQRPAGSTAPR